jgi:hypothetical protein
MSDSDLDQNKLKEAYKDLKEAYKDLKNIAEIYYKDVDPYMGTDLDSEERVEFYDASLHALLALAVYLGLNHPAVTKAKNELSESFTQCTESNITENIGNWIVHDDKISISDSDSYEDSESDEVSSESDSGSESESKWSLDDHIYNCLGPASGELIADARKLPKDEARSFLINCLGPASDDVLALSRGKIFTDDKSYSDSDSDSDSDFEDFEDSEQDP